MLGSLLGFLFWATVLALLARRRALHDDAEVLRQLSEADRRRVLARYPDLDRWRKLQNLVRDDVALEDQASVARFHFAPGTRRLTLWRAQKAALKAAGCLTIIIVSQAVNPLLNTIFGLLAALLLGLTVWRLLRLRRMADSVEVSPFNLTEVSHRGVRRVLSWQQSLELRNRPRRGCVEIGPLGHPESIRLDYRLLEFDRALYLVLVYGGFIRNPPAT